MRPPPLSNQWRARKAMQVPPRSSYAKPGYADIHDHFKPVSSQLGHHDLNPTTPIPATDGLDWQTGTGLVPASSAHKKRLAKQRFRQDYPNNPQAPLARRDGKLPVRSNQTHQVRYLFRQMGTESMFFKLRLLQRHPGRWRTFFRFLPLKDGISFR